MILTRLSLSLSFLMPLDSAELSLALWQKVPECIVFFPDGVRVVERVLQAFTVLPGETERKAVRDAAPRENGMGLFTIGYEGDSIDGYLNRLIRNNVHLLCDVRKNPLSRKTGFSKRQLAGYCEKVGIAYRHLPELGIPGSRRRELNSREDYDALFEEYEREDLPLAGNAIEELGRLLKEHKRIALTCFEKDHECCHRHCVAEAMERTLPDCPESMHI